MQAVVTALNSALALKAPLASPALAALVGSSPAALDTLNELAAALGNDPNFATTMTNALAGKQPLDSTLTALSGKTVADILQYLGIAELAKTPRYLVSKGSSANGWYEVYSDGFKRVGRRWYTSQPLTIPNPASGVVVAYPISFTNEVTYYSSVADFNIENTFESAQIGQAGLSSICLAIQLTTLSSSSGTSYGSKFAGSYIAEGY